MVGIQRAFGPKSAAIRAEPIQVIHQNGPANGRVDSHDGPSRPNLQASVKSTVSYYGKLRGAIGEWYTSTRRQINRWIRELPTYPNYRLPIRDKHDATSITRFRRVPRDAVIDSGVGKVDLVAARGTVLFVRALEEKSRGPPSRLRTGVPEHVRGYHGLRALSPDGRGGRELR